MVKSIQSHDHALAAIKDSASLLITFDGPQDPLNPQNWTFRTKFLQTILLSQSCVVVTFASSVFASGTAEVADYFGISIEVANLGTSLFLVGYIVGPPFWGPASEFLGRRRPILISYLGFAIFNIPSAVGYNVQTIMLGRFFAGAFAAGPLSIVAGSLGDMWSPQARGNALVAFAIAVSAGPVIGPVMGNFIVSSYLGWRWTSYITAIWAFLLLGLLILFAKESFVPVVLQEKARSLRHTSGNWALHSQLDEKRFNLKEVSRVYLFRPFAMLAQEPILLLLTIYVAFVYGLIFGLFEALPYVYLTLRGWKLGTSGLVFLSVLVGALIAGGVCFAFAAKYNRVLAERGGPSVPEERCLPMGIGAVAFPIGLFLFAFTGPEYVSSPWPSIVAIAFIGMGFVLIFVSALNLIIDCYLSLTNSAIAANTMVRSAAAAAYPLFATQMFRNLGVHWAGATLGFIAVALAPFPFVFRAFSAELLAKSKYAPKIPRGIKPQKVVGA